MPTLTPTPIVKITLTGLDANTQLLRLNLTVNGVKTDTNLMIPRSAVISNVLSISAYSGGIKLFSNNDEVIIDIEQGTSLTNPPVGINWGPKSTFVYKVTVVGVPYTPNPPIVTSSIVMLGNNPRVVFSVSLPPGATKVQYQYFVGGYSSTLTSRISLIDNITVSIRDGSLNPLIAGDVVSLTIRSCSDDGMGGYYDSAYTQAGPIIIALPAPPKPATLMNLITAVLISGNIRVSFATTGIDTNAFALNVQMFVNGIEGINGDFDHVSNLTFASYGTPAKLFKHNDRLRVIIKQKVQYGAGTPISISDPCINDYTINLPTAIVKPNPPFVFASGIMTGSNVLTLSILVNGIDPAATKMKYEFTVNGGSLFTSGTLTLVDAVNVIAHTAGTAFTNGNRIAQLRVYQGVVDTGNGNAIIWSDPSSDQSLVLKYPAPPKPVAPNVTFAIVTTNTPSLIIACTFTNLDTLCCGLQFDKKSIGIFPNIFDKKINRPASDILNIGSYDIEPARRPDQRLLDSLYPLSAYQGKYIVKGDLLVLRVAQRVKYPGATEEAVSDFAEFNYEVTDSTPVKPNPLFKYRSKSLTTSGTEFGIRINYATFTADPAVIKAKISIVVNLVQYDVNPYINFTFSNNLEIYEYGDVDENGEDFPKGFEVGDVIDTVNIKLGSSDGMGGYLWSEAAVIPVDFPIVIGAAPPIIRPPALGGAVGVVVE